MCIITDVNMSMLAMSCSRAPLVQGEVYCLPCVVLGGLCAPNSEDKL